MGHSWAAGGGVSSVVWAGAAANAVRHALLMFDDESKANLCKLREFLPAGDFKFTRSG